MSELNAEPSTRFRAILEGAERAARNIETDFDDPTDGDGQFIAKCIGSLTRRTQYLRAQAAAQWKPQFVNALKHAHSLRVEHADPMVKEMLRGFSMKCMACGRDEHRCTFRADLVGYFDRDDWQEARDLNASWTAFEDEYSACLECDPKGHLLEEDMGSFIVGETCLAKLQQYFRANTFLLDLVYKANNVMCDVGWGSLKELYSVTDERVKEAQDDLRDLELAIAQERRWMPPLKLDATLWEHVDAARAAVDKDPLECLHILCRRGFESMDMEPHLPGLQRKGDGDDEEENVPRREYDSDDEEEAPRRETKKGRHRPAKRARVIDDSSDESLFSEEESEEEEERRDAPVCTQKRGGSVSKPVRQSRRTRGLSPEPAPGEEAPVSLQRSKPSAMQSESEGPVRERAAQPGPRRAVPNAASLAQVARIPGERLPARRHVLLTLMEAQQRLTRDGRDDDADAVTAAIFQLREYEVLLADARSRP